MDNVSNISILTVSVLIYDSSFGKLKYRKSYISSIMLVKRIVGSATIFQLHRAKQSVNDLRELLTKFPNDCEQDLGVHNRNNV